MSYDNDNGSTNFDVNFIFSNIDIIFKKILFDEIKMKEKTNTAVKNPITYVPNSKYQIPKNDITIRPIRV